MTNAAAGADSKREPNTSSSTAAHARFSPLIVACLVATWFVWGSTYLGIKFALLSFPPFFQGGTRFLVAGTLLLLWVWWRGQKMPTLIQWRNAAVVGAVMLGGNMGGVVYAEQFVASGLVVTFIAIVPALITMASVPFGIRPSRLEVVGMGLGIFGVMLLGRGEAFTASPAGLMAMTIAALGFATGSVLSQHVLPLASGFAGFASAMIGGGVVLIALSAIAGERFHWPPQPLAAVAWSYLVIFGSLIAFSAYMVLLAKTRPSLAASYAFVNPAIGMLLGTSIGGETVTLHEWLAGAVIVIGVAMLVFGRPNRRQAVIVQRR